MANNEKHIYVKLAAYDSSGNEITDSSGNLAGNMIASKGGAATLLSATGTGAGTATTDFGVYSTFQASSDASHTGTTTVDIEVSNDNTLWLVMATLSVTGNSATDGVAPNAAWKYARANCTAHGDSTNVVTVTKGG